ncbi:MAG TPA: DUF3800 domain-containing protein [Phycisphaerales bacterium]|nr:DUF3800 domain-containing protein [Phycisphaerales bacterium]
MHLAYFDESKSNAHNLMFYIGGLLVPDEKIAKVESTLRQIQYNFFDTENLTKASEFHGIELFQGKGASKGRPLADRVKVFDDIVTCLINHSIPIRIIQFNVPAHKDKYIYPQPEYRLGLMLLLERFCDYLDDVDDLAMVFGDLEQDEFADSILDFSQFKASGKTPMYFGRPLGRLVDTIYFTHSHHSRFLQVADIIIYMANRYEPPGSAAGNWHDTQVSAAYQRLKAGTSFRMQNWP